MSSPELGVTLIGMGSVIINLGILGLCLKLYTEFFKERAKK